MSKQSTQHEAPRDDSQTNAKAIHRLLRLDLNATEKAFIYAYYRDKLTIDQITARLDISRTTALGMYNNLHDRMRRYETAEYARGRRMGKHRGADAHG